jgi:hypothetical protein
MLSSSGPSLLQMMTTSRLTMTPDAPTTPKRNSRRQLCAWRTKMKCRSRSMIERAYRPSPVRRRQSCLQGRRTAELWDGRTSAIGVTPRTSCRPSEWIHQCAYSLAGWHLGHL